MWFLLAAGVRPKEAKINLMDCSCLCSEVEMSYGPCVQKKGNSNYQTNHHPVDSVVYFVNTYPLQSDFSGTLIILAHCEIMEYLVIVIYYNLFITIKWPKVIQKLENTIQ